MGAGPLIGGAGLLLCTRVRGHADYVAEVLPAVLVFGLGLSLTVAPLTAAVLGGVAEEHAGIASAVNNAVARVGGLLAVAAVGAVVAAQLLDANADSPGAAAARTARQRALTRRRRVRARRAPRVQPALDDASVARSTSPCSSPALLVALGGVLSAVGIENPRRTVPCEGCPGGAAVGAEPRSSAGAAHGRR